MINFCRLLLIAFLLLSNVTYGSSGQSFDGINYINPANFYFTRTLFVGVGGTLTNSRINFSGTIDDKSLLKKSNTLILSPHGRIIYPVNSKLVFGLAVNEPFKAKTDFDGSGVVAGYNDKESIRSINISPTVGFELFKNLWLGLGLNFQRAYYDAHILIPLDISPTPKQVIFHGQDDIVTWHAGFLIIMSKKLFFNAAYFAPSNFQLRGTVEQDNITFPTRKPTKLVNPGVILSGLTYRINPKWLVKLRYSYSFWSNFNLSGIDLLQSRMAIPLDYRNTNRVSLLGHYQYSSTYAFAGFAAVDYTPSKVAQTGFALSGDVVSVGALISKKLNKHFSASLLGGYAFNISPVKIRENKLNTFGSIKDSALFGSLLLVYKA